MTNLRQQRAKGLLFTALALALVVSAVLNVRQGATGTAGLKLPLAVYLGYLAWRQLQPGAAVPVPTADERTQREVRVASSNAFYLLLMFMLGESMIEVIPAALETHVYLFVGSVFLGLAWGYQKLTTR